VQPLTLHVTDPASVTAAAVAAPDVTVLVNNARVLGFGNALTGDLASFERDLATNYLGTLRVTRAFAPSLQRNAPAAVVNILTLIALAPVGPVAGYSASKAAAHSITQALRAELRDRRITVLGAYPAAWTPTCSPASRRTRRRPKSWPNASSPPWPPGTPSYSPMTRRPPPDRSTYPTRSNSSTCWPADTQPRPVRTPSPRPARQPARAFSSAQPSGGQQKTVVFPETEPGGVPHAAQRPPASRKVGEGHLNLAVDRLVVGAGADLSSTSGL
jgi:NAD(P)-dependent dehydrogenase (short-subunit alcohol dehydrogenase family)